MKKSLRIASAIALLLAGLSQSLVAQSNLHWVGGTLLGAGDGNWSNRNNWRLDATNSGLTPAAAPTINDNVFFTEASFSALGTYGSRVVVSTSTPAPACANFSWVVANRRTTLEVNTVLRIGGATTIVNGTVQNNTNNNRFLTITTTVPATSSITFTSTSPTTIQSGGLTSSVHNVKTTYGVPLVFNGINGQWTLLDNMTVSRNVTFTNGYVIAKPSPDPRPSYDPKVNVSGNNGTVTNPLATSPRFGFTSSSAIVVTANNASHVVGFVQIVDANNTIQDLTLPTGDGGIYRPIVVRSISNGGGGATNIITRYYNNIPAQISLPTTIHPTLGAGLTAPMNDKEYWYVAKEGGSASPRFTLNYNNTNPALPANYYRIDKWQGLTVAGLHDNSGMWALKTSTVSNPATATTVEMDGSGSSNSAWFTIARVGNFSLPVHLISFTGQQLNGQVQLKWQSSDEKNTSHFEVERSADGKNFSKLLTKQAQGNSSTLVSYNAIDNSPLGGTSYYRLKMVDLDGTTEYSKIVAVSADGTLVVRTYPNPSKGNGINLTAGNGSKLVLKSVSDLFGKQVGYQQRNAGENLQVNFTQPLPAGFYVATLAGSDSGELVKIKFVVQ